MHTPMVTGQTSMDRLAKSVIGGFTASAAMALILLLADLLAVVFANVSANPSASGQLMSNWFRAAADSEFTGLAHNTAYAVIAVQFVLGVGGAILFAAPEGATRRTVWRRSGLLSAALLFISMVAILPLLGAGMLGSAIGAGPLPLFGMVLASLAFAGILGAAGSPALDQILGPANDADRWQLSQTARTSAIGLAAGLVLGGIAGIAWMVNAAFASSHVVGAPPAAVALAFAMSGAALGWFLGTLLVLTAVPASVPVTVRGQVRRTVVPPESAPFRLAAAFRAVGANGACPQGYRVGALFQASSAGVFDPPLCPAAAAALQPLAAAMVAGSAGAPRRISCPIFDHALVFELRPAA